MDSEMITYTHKCVYKDAVIMFDRFMAGLEISDFGSIKYKYFAEWGLIEKDDFTDNMRQAEAISDLESVAGGIRNYMKSPNRNQNIVAVAKLISVKNLFQAIKYEGVHINAYIERFA